MPTTQPRYYVGIDVKSFCTSVEHVERGLDPLTIKMPPNIPANTLLIAETGSIMIVHLTHRTSHK